MVNNPWQLAAFVIFNLAALSIVLFTASGGLWIAGKIKAAAGFDPSVLQNPFSHLLRRNFLIMIGMIGLSLLIFGALVITS